MGFLTKEGLQNLTNKLVQGDAIKVASHRGKNVKEVIDNIQRECENVALPNTMNLENRINEFKVGKGRDIDVSGDIEESKIEVELQGKTWQNLTGFGASFQARHPSVFEKIDDEDSLLVKRISSDDSGWVYWCNDKLKRTLIKPDTKYTLLFKFDSNKNYNLQVGLRDGSSANLICNSISATRVFSNIYMAKLTTVSNFDGLGNAQVIYFHSGIPSKKGDWSRYYKDMILLEGDYTQTPVEELPKYFEGIKSSFEDGIVDVEVQGKNLFDNSKIRDHSLISFDGEYVTCVSDGKGYQVFNNTDSAKLLKPNKTYYISVNVIENTLDSTFEVQFGVGEGRIENAMPKLHSYIDSKFTGVKKNTGVTQSDLKGKNILDCRMVSNSKSGYIRFKIMITEVENEKFEPYYKKKISFNIGEPLRSLPNGVCDEIRNNKGQWELVRRTAKVILNGSENWDNSYSGWNNKVFCCPNNYLPNIKYAPTNVSNVLSTLLPSANIATLCSKLGYTGICTHAWNLSWLQVAKNGIETVEQLKSWLSENPTTVYYELTKPIITPIEPIEFNISQGAVININSNISPASTHKVILNRAGQIEQGIELIANLKSRIDELENIYDSNLIATQYRLNNLKLNYELEREED